MADACCGPDEPRAAGAGGAGHDDVEDEVQTPLWQVRELQLAAASGLLLLVGVLLTPSLVETAVFYAAVLAGGATFVPSALRGLRRGRLGVGLLMTIAAAGALILGDAVEAATLAFLFSIAEGLEDYAVTRTRNGLKALLGLAPRTATVLRGTSPLEVGLAELRVGDLLLVRPGERFATDGVVRSGRSAVDTSVVTGESVPVEVGPGVDVFAGTINGNGSLEVEASAAAADNSLARLVHVVQEAQQRKGNSQRVAERVARPLVPAVLVLAALVALVGSLLGEPGVWIPRALVVLVAAAPCALALSVPVTVVAAIGAASRGGVLVKGGAAVEALGAVQVVALDKTGTLTRNEPTVVEVVPAGASTPTEVLAVAAALEARSEHPLAAAILAATNDRLPAADVEAVPGQGLTGTVDGHRARLGKPGFVDPGPLEAAAARLQDAGATVVLVERDQALLGLVAVRDEVRPEAAEAVAMLRRQGLRVVMLTGDNRRTAAAVAAAAGIDEVHAELSPQGKAALVAQLGARARVAMVGDGINDAPALATASCGVAMGAMGSDVAVEAADVALMGVDLRRLPDAVAHARAARRILVQNLVLSCLIIAVLVPVSAFGVLGLAVVVATHELAEVVVILNGIRAARRRHLPTRAGIPRPARVAAPPSVGPGGPVPAAVGTQQRRQALLTLTPALATSPLTSSSDRSSATGAAETDGCGSGCSCCT